MVLLREKGVKIVLLGGREEGWYGVKNVLRSRGIVKISISDYYILCVCVCCVYTLLLWVMGWLQRGQEET